MLKGGGGGDAGSAAPLGEVECEAKDARLRHKAVTVASVMRFIAFKIYPINPEFSCYLIVKSQIRFSQKQVFRCGDFNVLSVSFDQVQTHT